MKIKKITASIHQIPIYLPMIEKPMEQRVFTFCEVETDDGLTGCGVTGAFLPWAQVAAIEHEIFPVIEGHGPARHRGDPSRRVVEGQSARLYRRGLQRAVGGRHRLLGHPRQEGGPDGRPTAGRLSRLGRDLHHLRLSVLRQGSASRIREEVRRRRPHAAQDGGRQRQGRLARGRPAHPRRARRGRRRRRPDDRRQLPLPGQRSADAVPRGRGLQPDLVRGTAASERRPRARPTCATAPTSRSPAARWKATAGASAN